MQATVTDNIDLAAAVLSKYRVRCGSEADVQAAIAEILRAHGFDYRREVRLSPRSRIDFLLGDVGIEVKTRGGAVDLLRQVRRYLEHDAVAGLLVVSTITRLGAAVPARVNGKPVRTVVLAGAAL